jgi:hypothetical protein
VHVDQTKPASRFLASEKNRVRISHYSNVADALICVRLYRRTFALRAVWRNR